MIDLTIVIVNYNVRHFLSRCLDSIVKSELGQYRITTVVVDNDSIDGSVEYLKQNYSWIKLIENRENQGFSKANNLALRQLDSQYVLLLNPDTILSPDTLRVCLDYMNLHLDVGALGVRMIDGQGNFLPESKRAKPTPWNSFCKLSGLSSLFPNSKLFSGYNLGYLDEFENHDIDVLCGAFMMMPSEVVKKVGLLDERFFMYAEDIDLSVRIKENGNKVVYLAESSIIHYKGESTKKGSANYVKQFYLAMYQYVEKHYGNQKSFLLFIKAGIFFRGFLSLLKRFLKNWLRPFLDFVLIYFVMQGLKNFWGNYYFHDSQYFDNQVIRYNFLVYSFLWVLGLKFTGWYYEDARLGRLISGMGLGTLLILIVYALFPAEYRTSRALILLGSIVTTFILLMIHLLFKLGINRKSRAGEQATNALLVCDQNHVDKLLKITQKHFENITLVGVISPVVGDHDLYYLNSIDRLHEVVKDIRVEEVIFSNDDVDISTIIHAMEKLPSNINYKIGGGSHLGLIGSKVGSESDGLYKFDVSFRIEKLFWKRIKRMIDIFLGFIILVLFPIFIVFRPIWVKSCLAIIFGKKTCVTYGGEKNDYFNLPKLKEGIIKINTEPNFNMRERNFEYAKNYNGLVDFKRFWNELFQKK